MGIKRCCITPFSDLKYSVCLLEVCAVHSRRHARLEELSKNHVQCNIMVIPSIEMYHLIDICTDMPYDIYDNCYITFRNK